MHGGSSDACIPGELPGDGLFRLFSVRPPRLYGSDIPRHRGGERQPTFEFSGVRPEYEGFPLLVGEFNRLFG
jgi:hypothetical protein